DVLGGGPLGGPFGYRNATGAFYAQAAIAGLLLAATVRWLPVRLVAFLAAGGFALVAVIGSSAAAASLAVVPIALLALGGRVWARVSVAVAGVLVLLVLAGTVVLGATYRPGSDGEVVRALSERRLVLWHESLRLIADHPGGVGPGRFRDVDPTARRDADARWAHNEFLQQGVELGWAGLVLTVLLFAWGFARLLVRPDPDVAVGLGAAALAALGIHASVDYVLHFAAVPLTAAALVGTAQAAPIRRFRRGRHEPGQEDLEGGADAVRVAGTTTSR
ncbi:MAG: O-antigen ligase family protein, partial [Candidatus Velamenicoccus archaeovorus]